MKSVSLFLLSLITASGAAAVSISGTVRDALTQAPLGSMVTAAYTPGGAFQASATTDPQGRYILNVSAGSYRVLAYDRAGVYATGFNGDADSFESSPVVDATNDINALNFSLRRGGTINGSVSAAATGVLLSGMTVAAYNLSTGTRRGFTQSAANGMYSLVLPPGQYKIAAYDNSGTYAPRFYPDQATFASAATVSVTAGISANGINFQLPIAAHLNGRVFDADANVILSGTTVFAYPLDGIAAAASALSDATGNFTLAVGPGSYKLVVADASQIYAAGYVNDANSFANEGAISVAAGQIVTEIRIPLHRAGSVTGRVTDSGAPLAGITVAAYNDDGSQRAATQTDPAGAYVLLLPAGSFRIAAYDNSITYATQFYRSRNVFSEGTPVSVATAQITRAIDFSLVRGTRFNGTITDRSNGTAISGISVAAYDQAGNVVATGTSDATGNYTLVVPSGNYKLVAFDTSLRYATAYSGSAANYEAAALYQVDGDESQRVDFRPTRGVRVSGIVADASSAFVPLSGIQIDALDSSGNRIATTVTNGGAFDLVLTPGIYKLLAVDPLHRFYATFYNSAYTLAEATPVVVQSNGVEAPIKLLLARLARHRAIGH